MTTTERKTTEDTISEVCKSIANMLIEKNRSCGNAALDPVRIFAKGIGTDAQLRVRIDDKLSRIARGTSELGEDTINDLIGYLVLLKVHRCTPKQKQDVSCNACEHLSRERRTERVVWTCNHQEAGFGVISRRGEPVGSPSWCPISIEAASQ